MSTYKRYGHGLHSFLSHLASGVDPVPGFDQVTLLQLYPEGMVHLLHVLLSVLVGPYYTAWRLFACHVELPTKGLPPVVKIPVEAFGLQSTM